MDEISQCLAFTYCYRKLSEEKHDIPTLRAGLLTRELEGKSLAIAKYGLFNQMRLDLYMVWSEFDLVLN